MNKILCLVVALGIISLSASAQKNKTIAISKGDKFQMRVSVDQITEVMPGMNVTSNSTTYGSIAVIDKIKNDFLLTQTLDSIKIDMSGMGINQSFNSQNPKDAESEMGKEMLGSFHTGERSYLLLNSSTGVTESVDQEGKPVTKTNEVAGTIGGIGDIKGAEGMSIMKILPANVKPGDKWSDSSEINGIKTINNYTLIKIDDKTLYVDIQASMNGQTTIDANNQTTDVTINGTGSGNILIDRKTSLTKKSVIKTNMDTGADVMGQTMKMNMKSTTTVELL